MDWFLSLNPPSRADQALTFRQMKYFTLLNMIGHFEIIWGEYRKLAILQNPIVIVWSTFASVFKVWS